MMPASLPGAVGPAYLSEPIPGTQAPAQCAALAFASAARIASPKAPLPAEYSL